jgi:hypothetical protein
MLPPALQRLFVLNLVAFTCTIAPAISGGEPAAAESTGTPAPARSGQPAEQQPAPSRSSVTAHLGIKFSPAAKDAPSAYAAPQLLDSIFPVTVVLPAFVVQDPRVKLTEKEVLTDKARLALAEKRFLSPLYRATLGPLSQLAAYYFDWTSILRGWHPNEVEAMVLYRQEEELKQQAEMDRLLKLEAIDQAPVARPMERLRFDKPVEGLLIKVN